MHHQLLSAAAVVLLAGGTQTLANPGLPRGVDPKGTLSPSVRGGVGEMARQRKREILINDDLIEQLQMRNYIPLLAPTIISPV